MQARLLEGPGELLSELCPGGKGIPDGEDHRRIGVAHVPFRALSRDRTRGLFQTVTAMNFPVLSPTSGRAPSAMRDTVLDGEIERGAVGTGLAAGDDFLDTEVARF